ncbi:hypothetical protein BC629DRAFT_1718486 [Irpex lacteus]|nr:hypothetical protein BC629DRAFT_1718486 [Irpex lacteus]
MLRRSGGGGRVQRCRSWKRARRDPRGRAAEQDLARPTAHGKQKQLPAVEQLRSKKLDLGFRVDPLFRKTCADFDEGVSNGSLRVVFDASDLEDSLEEPPDEVNLTGNYVPNLDDLEDKAICHSLDGFCFSKDTFAMDDLTIFRDDIAGVDPWDNNNNNNEPAGFNDDGSLQQPMDVDGAMEDFFLDSPSAGSDHAEGREEGGSGGGGNLMKNWVGPEHWKLRKVVRRPMVKLSVGHTYLWVTAGNMTCGSWVPAPQVNLQVYT